MIGVLSVLLPMSVQAWSPNDKDVKKAIRDADFTPYYAKLGNWLNEETPTDPDGISAASLQDLLNKPGFAKALTQRQFIGKVGPANLAASAKDKSNHEFLAFVLGSGEAMAYCLEGATPWDIGARKDNSWGFPVSAFQNWKRIFDDDSDSKTGVPLKLAIAVGLNPPGSGNRGAGQAAKPADPLARYYHFKKAYADGELTPNFSEHSVWDYRQIVSSNASDEDLAWARKAINTWRPDLRKNEMVVNSTSEVWRRNSPVPFNNSYKNVLAGGGKCGPRSSWAVFVNQAFGIPTIGVGQPGHACAAYKSPNPDVHPQPGKTWKVVYGRGWGASRPGWNFFEGATLRANLAEFMQVEHMRWLASSLKAGPHRDKIVSIGEKMIEQARKAAHAAPLLFEKGITMKADAVTRLDTLASPLDTDDDFATRIRGFVYPPETGHYRFGIAGDDDADLFLSKDESPEKKEHIASVRGWTLPSDFRKFAGAKAIKLEAGKKYYIEAIHIERGGGDHVSVGWHGPGVEAGVILGDYISPYPSGPKGGIDREVWQNIASRMPKKEELAPDTRAEAPIKVPDGVIHVEAETHKDGSAMRVLDCFEGGKQVNFGKSQHDAWVEYVVDVPKAGEYELTMLTAAVNFDQKFMIGAGDKANAPVTLPVPNSHGLWETTEPVVITLAQGSQPLRVKAPFQREVALRWLALKAK